jgi:hypothetical protein
MMGRGNYNFSWLKNLIPYYFEYEMPSKLRRSHFLNMGFSKKKLKRCTFREFKTQLNFSSGKKCVKCVSFIRSNIVYKSAHPTSRFKKSLIDYYCREESCYTPLIKARTYINLIRIAVKTVESRHWF